MKKHYRLEYLESFIGKEFINRDGTFHIRVLGLSNFKYARNTFTTQLSTCAVYGHITLTNQSNGSIDVDTLLRGYIPKTPIARLIYVNE